MWPALLAAGLLVLTGVEPEGILYPRESETREVLLLDGVWKFRTSLPPDRRCPPCEEQFSMDPDGWIPMPVPSSFNDVTASAGVRDFVGWVWYQRHFFVPSQWKTNSFRVFLRFSDVHYASVVWVNDRLATSHEGGHLPFQAEVTGLLRYGEENTVTVGANNTLTGHTIPQGTAVHTDDSSRYPPGYMLHSILPDYFNYAGIQRSVHLYTVPQTFVSDITISTSFDNTTGVVQYWVDYTGGGDTAPLCTVAVEDEGGAVVATGSGLSGTVLVPRVKLWWARHTDSRPGHLYTLRVELARNGQVLDVYRQQFGVRTLEWSNTALLLNGRPVYLTGFGKHEDSDVRGKGFDNTLLIRDFNLIDWLGANSFRTSHYPYAEETLDMADQAGIMIIDESPACSLDLFSDELLQRHKSIMQEMIQRDKNHPSVIMWSLANEPRSDKNQSASYFSSLYNYTRKLDSSRPITFVNSQSVENDKAVQFMDVVCLNRYRAWYSDPGHLELIGRQVESELTAWHVTHDKPVLMTEYGAGAVVGMHTLPAQMWTEDYEVMTLVEHFKIFDKLRAKGFLLGEMIWNFADFLTPEETFRPRSCVKGLFTRERQPKMAAHWARSRYWSLAHELDGFQLPSDLLFRSL
ncbi:beta-glucuronidase-like [Bacillus rossius redtenbacheri]|uniref:beta-glucuronidase-like n=1 Tax=Bacillus rossius redtenbacheri TaxID=93214 RepID=UPI002FDCF0A8